MFGIQDDVCWWNIRWEQIIAKSIQVGTRVRKLRWLVGSTEVVEKTKGRMPGFLRVILSPGCITTELLLCNASWWCRLLPCVFQPFVFHWIDWRQTKKSWLYIYKKKTVFWRLFFKLLKLPRIACWNWNASTHWDSFKPEPLSAQQGHRGTPLMLDWPFTSHLSHHPWHLAASTVQLNPALNTSSAECSKPQQSAANAVFSPLHGGSLQQFGINPLGPFLRSAWGSPCGSFLGLEDLSSSSVCSSLTSRDSTPPPATSPLSPPVHPPASKKCTFDAAFPSPPPLLPFFTVGRWSLWLDRGQTSSSPLQGVEGKKEAWR